MEKGALVGMMALALSDLLFCVATISGSFLHSQIIHESRDMSFYYTLYGTCVNNILIKTSTWFTVILAASRFFAVSHPIKARQYMRCGHTVVAILVCLAAWICLHVPLAYLWKVQTVECDTGQAFVVTSGPFQENMALKLTFSYVWFVAGFAFPVLVLAYCNIRLIHSLKISTALRENDEIRHRGSSSAHSKQSRDTTQRRISLTLVIIVTMFFLLVLPSEIAHFYEDIAKPDFEGGFDKLMAVCNLLQVINFSENFILYCIVNAYFRKTLYSWFLFLSCREGRGFSLRGVGRHGSNYSVTVATKNTIVAQHSCNPDTSSTLL